MGSQMMLINSIFMFIMDFWDEINVDCWSDGVVSFPQEKKRRKAELLDILAFIKYIFSFQNTNWLCSFPLTQQ
jgi:hypothetical protein